MARDLDRLLDDWARWQVSGGADVSTSPLGKLIENNGLVIQGTGAGGPMDTIEARIDALVAELSVKDLLAADVLRMEYNAAVFQVLQRRRVRGYDPRRPDREMKAAALGISGRTYRRRLNIARRAVMDGLANGRK